MIGKCSASSGLVAAGALLFNLSSCAHDQELQGITFTLHKRSGLQTFWRSRSRPESPTQSAGLLQSSSVTRILRIR